VTGRWRKLHNEELHYFYSSPSIIRIIKEGQMGRACSKNLERREMQIGFGVKEGKRPLGRLRRRWVDNIKMALTEME
jgi:hypothetical protein